MDGHFTPNDISVTMPDRHRFGYRRDSGGTAQDRRDVAAGEVLLAHAHSRIVVALVVALLHVMLLRDLPPGLRLEGGFVPLLASLIAYLALVGFVKARVRRDRSASRLLVSVELIGDLLFVFCVTAFGTTPDHYARALFGTIVVVHIANFFFGRRQAWRVVQFGIAGYVVLDTIAVMRGMRVDLAEELLTLAMCAAGIVLTVLQAGDVRRRLRNIVKLFEHAEDGDFSREYDAAADGRPDAITRVGVAYNGVRAQLANMVLTDPLTGCLNRRGFDQALAREVGRAKRARSEFALLAIDLDHFKLVNDTYGHLAGDIVLKSVGALLVKAGRVGDVVARVGGEEFAILLADTGEAGAHLFASRLCELVRSQPFVIGAHLAPVTLTTSIGVAIAAPRGAENYAELVWAQADDALYEAKRANRNCVRVWTSSTRGSGEYAAIPFPQGQLSSHA